MRSFVFFTCLLFIVSCSPKKTTQKPFFLIGDWQRINTKEGKATYEFWKSDFSGLGITLQNKDTVFKETLSIIQKNDTLYLQVEGVNEQPTLFRITRQTDTSFLAENPANEFPKKIKYWYTHQKLYAKIWNDESFAIDFIFRKIPQEPKN